MPTSLPKRAEVPEHNTWDLRSVFPSDEAWETELAQVSAELPGLEAFRGKLGESAATLLQALQSVEAVMTRVGRIRLYAQMQVASDTADPSYVARGQQAIALVARTRAASGYIEPEILALEPARLRALLVEVPDLRPYEHYFNNLERQRAHIRSPEVEQLLASAAEVDATARQVHAALVDADLRFGMIRDQSRSDVEVAQGNVTTLINDQDRSVRQAAWEVYADAHLAVKNTLAAAVAGGIKGDVFFARARGYASALDMDLGKDNLPREVFDNLLATFRRRLPVWHRYWEIRRRALGVEELHAYDVHVPLVRAARSIPFQEAIDTICTAMQPLGDTYTVPMRRGLVEQRWADIYPNQGKGSGAFSTGVHGTHPFLMMNYADRLENLSTLAHELGHSMHSYLTWQHQPPIYARYSMFAAETASNFNQALVRAHLLNSSDDPDFQLEILAEAMSNFLRYLFIMPTLARFTLDCHTRVERGEGLTADGMSATLVELFREAYGPGVVLDEPRVGITLAQFPHLFMNFYVFTYSTGISAANALADGVLRDGPAAAERYLNFLKAGGSMYAIDALRLAGIDMRSPEPVERAFDMLEGFVDRLDRLVGPGPLRQ